MATQDFSFPRIDARAQADGIGASVAGQVELPLAVVNRALSAVWSNDAARARRDAAWDALAAGGAASGPQALLRSQLQGLVVAALRTQARTESLVESCDGTWFASATALQGHDGLVLLRLSAMHQLAAAGARERVHRLFGLSQAESHVAVQLACGLSLDDIAEARSVSVDTVRAQVRSVFHKTGIHRQGALICAVGKLTDD